jgi:hypothetical protein
MTTGPEERSSQSSHRGGAASERARASSKLASGEAPMESASPRSRTAPCALKRQGHRWGPPREVGVSRPISRVLSGGLPLRDGHSSGTPLARRLEQPTRAAAGIEPGALGAHDAPNIPRRPYSVLLPVGFAVPPPSPEARCALTAPFHPCRCGLPRAGGLFSVALSLGLPPAAISRHRQSLEPGLSSTARLWPQSRFARQRPSGRLTGGIRGEAGRGSRAKRAPPSFGRGKAPCRSAHLRRSRRVDANAINRGRRGDE